MRTCTSQPEGAGVTARLRSCLGSAPGDGWTVRASHPPGPACGAGETLCLPRPVRAGMVPPPGTAPGPPGLQPGVRLLHQGGVVGIEWMPGQESNLQLRRSGRRLRTDTECPAVAVPRGAAPLPPARQAGVQVCYTMAPGRALSTGAHGGPTGCLPPLKGFGGLSGRWTPARWTGRRESRPLLLLGREPCFSHTPPGDRKYFHGLAPRGGSRSGLPGPRDPPFAFAESRPDCQGGVGTNPHRSSARPRVFPPGRAETKQKTPRPFPGAGF